MSHGLQPRNMCKCCKIEVYGHKKSIIEITVIVLTYTHTRANKHTLMHKYIYIYIYAQSERLSACRSTNTMCACIYTHTRTPSTKHIYTGDGTWAVKWDSINFSSSSLPILLLYVKTMNFPRVLWLWHWKQHNERKIKLEWNAFFSFNCFVSVFGDFFILFYSVLRSDDRIAWFFTFREKIGSSKRTIRMGILLHFIIIKCKRLAAMPTMTWSGGSRSDV